MIEKVKSEDT